jgi:putative hemolysin
VVYLELALLLAALALFTAYEMAVFSTRPDHIRRLSQEGDRRATIVMTFLRSPLKILAALQVGSTFASLAIGALVQPQFSSPLAGWLRGQGGGKESETLAGLIVLSAMTLVTLITSNLIPKRIAWSHADAIAVRYARVGRIWLWLMLPFLWMTSSISNLVLRILRVRLPRSTEVAEADMKVLLDRGARQGTIDPRENAIVRNTFALSDVSVERLMTPRDRIQWIDLRRPLAKLQDEAGHSGRSRLLASKGSLDSAYGVVPVKDLLEIDADPESIVEQVLRVPPDCSALQLLDQFRGHAARLALVEDPAGRVLGLVTLNDLVTAILGEVKALQT